MDAHVHPADRQLLALDSASFPSSLAPFPTIPNAHPSYHPLRLDSASFAHFERLVGGVRARAMLLKK